MTGPITLHTAIAAYPHVQAIRSGTVASALLRFDFEDVPVITRAFRRMVRTLDFDLCEIALTTLAQAHAYGKPITALPIVVMRGFHHAALVCPVGSLIRGPTDLRGKRIGVRAWSQTTGVWVRGILLEDYGVDHRDIVWVTEEDAHVQEYIDPPNVQRIAPGQDLRAMLASGEIDAAIALTGVDPATVRPVIADPTAAAAAWFARTGAYPVNHLLSGQPSAVREVGLDRGIPLAAGRTDGDVHRGKGGGDRAKRGGPVRADCWGGRAAIWIGKQPDEHRILPALCCQARACADDLCS
jgi:4,5-dihydroxyphthalate decarboxylase